MKLSMLNSKIRADLLVAIKMNIDIQINIKPMVIMYTSTLSNYRNTVNQRHTNDNNPKNTCKGIQTLAGCGGKGKDGGRGIRQGGRGRKRRGSGNPNDHCNDEWQVTGIDGNMIKVQPPYFF